MNPLAGLRAAWSIQRAPRWRPELLRQMQERKLQRVIQHAWNHVPYYRRLLDGAAIDPDGIRTPEDLARIPISTREDLQDAGDDLLSSFYRRQDLVERGVWIPWNGRIILQIHSIHNMDHLTWKLALSVICKVELDKEQVRIIAPMEKMRNKHFRI